MKKIINGLILLFFASTGFAQEVGKLSDGQLGAEMAKTIMHKWPDSLTHQPGTTAKWSYDLGVFFEGMANIYRINHDSQYLNYMKHIMDVFVKPDGTLQRYTLKDYNIDYVKNARTLLFLYKTTGEDKYLKAARLLRTQLDTHPRTKEGGFWHKKYTPTRCGSMAFIWGSLFTPNGRQLSKKKTNLMISPINLY